MKPDFTIVHRDGLFRLTDAKGVEIDSDKNVKRLEKAAWARGANVLRHDYHLGLAER